MNIFLDGEFAFGLSSRLADSLRVGQGLSQQEIDDLQKQDSQQTALQLAFEQVARRPRTEKEIRDYLHKKEREEDVIEAVVSRLKELDYLNDEDFAQQWIENRQAFRPRSRSALQFELRQKGVSSDILRTTLQGYDDREAALSAARAALRKYRNHDPENFRKKMFGYLSRRGFQYEVTRSVVEEIMRGDVDQE